MWPSALRGRLGPHLGLDFGPHPCPLVSRVCPGFEQGGSDLDSYPKIRGVARPPAPPCLSTRPTTRRLLSAMQQMHTNRKGQVDFPEFAKWFEENDTEDKQYDFFTIFSGALELLAGAAESRMSRGVQTLEELLEHLDLGRRRAQARRGGASMSRVCHML